MKRIGVFHQNDSYGKAGLDGVLRALKPLGLEPAGLGTVERNTVAVDAAAQSILAAKPEAIVQISAYRSCTAFIRAARKAGFFGTYNVSFVGTQALAPGASRPRERLSHRDPATQDRRTTQARHRHQPRHRMAPHADDVAGSDLAPQLLDALATVRKTAADRARFDPMTARRMFTVRMRDISEVVRVPQMMTVLGRSAPGIRLERALMESGARNRIRVRLPQYLGPPHFVISSDLLWCRQCWPKRSRFIAR